jgi:hypothetical protein
MQADFNNYGGFGGGPRQVAQAAPHAQRYGMNAQPNPGPGSGYAGKYGSGQLSTPESAMHFGFNPNNRLVIGYRITMKSSDYNKLTINDLMVSYDDPTTQRRGNRFGTSKSTQSIYNFNTMLYDDAHAARTADAVWQTRLNAATTAHATAKADYDAAVAAVAAGAAGAAGIIAARRARYDEARTTFNNTRNAPVTSRKYTLQALRQSLTLAGVLVNKKTHGAGSLGIAHPAHPDAVPVVYSVEIAVAGTTPCTGVWGPARYGSQMYLVAQWTTVQDDNHVTFAAIQLRPVTTTNGFVSAFGAVPTRVRIQPTRREGDPTPEWHVVNFHAASPPDDAVRADGVAPAGIVVPAGIKVMGGIRASQRHMAAHIPADNARIRDGRETYNITHINLGLGM